MMSQHTLVAQFYDERLKPCNQLQTPDVTKPRIWHSYCVVVKDLQKSRSEMGERGVVANAALTDWRTTPAETPFADWAYKNLLSLPIFPRMSTAESKAVIEALLTTV